MISSCQIGETQKDYKATDKIKTHQQASYMARR